MVNWWDGTCRRCVNRDGTRYMCSSCWAQYATERDSLHMAELRATERRKADRAQAEYRRRRAADEAQIAKQKATERAELQRRYLQTPSSQGGIGTPCAFPIRIDIAVNDL